jgi:hypothetical protein
MRNACKSAGIASYSPHDLRHRYISVKIREGVPGSRKHPPHMSDMRGNRSRWIRMRMCS